MGLCSAHHRAVHEGRLTVAGRVSSGLRFTHADGTTYGKPSSPEISDRFTKLFAALRNLGFGEAQTRRAVAAVQRNAATKDLEALLREALALLTRGSA